MTSATMVGWKPSPAVEWLEHFAMPVESRAWHEEVTRISCAYEDARRALSAESAETRISISGSAVYVADMDVPTGVWTTYAGGYSSCLIFRYPDEGWIT